ncbi:MAG: L-rhamnose mutarotase [Bacteroidetes bacterium]|nr:L-rhamnose mutarotase [Bacteroidota bacterium]
MPRIAFTMKLFPGRTAEYKKRHDDIWPELSELVRYSEKISSTLL